MKDDIYIQIVIKKDEEGHLYTIPTASMEIFEDLVCIESRHEEFEERFGKYRIKNGLHNCDLYMRNSVLFKDDID